MSKLIINYLTDIKKILKQGNHTEHSFRPALKQLLEKLDSNILALNEPKRIKCGAPDFLISFTNNSPLTIGYIETKPPEANLSNIEKNDQMKRYLSSINNLILTNFLEFRWYINGELKLISEIATISKDNVLINNKGILTTEKLLECFINHRLEIISSAKELAEKMARITLLIRDTTLSRGRFR